MADVPAEVVDPLIVAEAAVPTVVANDEQAPHKESCTERGAHGQKQRFLRPCAATLRIANPPRQGSSALDALNSDGHCNLPVRFHHTKRPPSPRLSKAG